MGERPSQMARDISETPSIIERQDPALARALRDVLAPIRRRPPGIIVSCARGSSAHAATFGKHLFERYMGLPVAAAAPSIASVYRRRLHLRDQLVLAISQSGRSDDLIAFASEARAAGALTVAVTNDSASPMARVCDFVLPIGAGPERGVAATKTFIATATVLARLAAAWAQNAQLTAALGRLPQRLVSASRLDWKPAAERLSRAMHVTIIGRGATLAIAQEAALKLKEICNLHAEAFSGAEFQHGPIALVASGYPVLMFMPTDEAATSMRLLLGHLQRKNADLLMTGGGTQANVCLAVLPSDHPETDALCLIQSFYAMTLGLAERLGIDADRPRNLQKVTRTK